MRKGKKWDARKAAKAAARKAFFEQGGTPAMWRGRAACLDMAGSKARKNKNQCRGNDRSLLRRGATEECY